MTTADLKPRYTYQLARRVGPGVREETVLET